MGWWVLLVLTAGWSGALRSPTQAPAAREVLEDARRLEAWYDAATRGTGRASVSLDLGQDAHRAFLLRRLQAAGKTPRSAPELFRRLAAARARSPSPGEAGLWCDHALLLRPALPSPSGEALVFPVSVRVSCLGGADYVFADLIAQDASRDDSTRTVLASRAGEEFAGGTDFLDVAVDVPASPADGHLLRVESLALASDARSGRDFVSYAVARHSLALRPDGGHGLVHPRALVPGAGEEVLLCQARGGTDCDYAQVTLTDGVPEPFTAQPTGLAAALPDTPGRFSAQDYWPFTSPPDPRHLLLPVRARLSPGARPGGPCTVARYTAARLKLLDTARGATCVPAVDPRALLPTGLVSGPVDFLAAPSTLLNEDLPDAPACEAAALRDAPLSLSLTLVGEARCEDADGTATLEPFHLSDALDRRAPGARRLVFREGCLAEGTPITLADGRGVPVEDVRPGDRVRADTLGAVLTVTDVSRGQEPEPLVLLRDSAGHVLRLTERHPVLLPDGGGVAAGALHAGDTVRTDAGPARLVSVARVPGGTRVFNLRLGTASELARRPAGAPAALFAGGFLVGDLALQRALATPPPSASPPLARLPPAWHADLHHALAR